GGGAITTRKSAGQVWIDSNWVASKNACIIDDGSPGMKVTNNQLIALSGGDTQRTLVSTHPDALLLENNRHQGGDRDNSIRLMGRGTARIVNEQIVSGYPDYGSVDIVEQ